MLSKRWEDALIAYAIKEWLLRSHTEIGRTIVQKIAYFLKAKGVPMDYDFDIYHYGPYSQELYYRMDDLLVDSVIIDRSASSSRSSYVPGPEIEEVIHLYEKDIRRYQQEIADVINMFSDLRPNQMEILATIHYFHVALKRFYGKSPDKELVVKRVFEVKGEKFEREVISRIYDTMNKAGLLVWEPDNERREMQ